MSESSFSSEIRSDDDLSGDSGEQFMRRTELPFTMNKSAYPGSER